MSGHFISKLKPIIVVIVLVAIADKYQEQISTLLTGGNPLAGFISDFRTNSNSSSTSQGDFAQPGLSADMQAEQNSDDQIFSTLFANRRSNVQVMGSGKISRILPDDNDGSRHQRFIVQLASGQTLLFAHNIDLAPRINAPAINDPVTFYGEYEWNAEGGVIHWTHSDPQRRHIGGWIVHNKYTYR